MHALSFQYSNLNTRAHRRVPTFDRVKHPKMEKMVGKFKFSAGVCVCVVGEVLFKYDATSPVTRLKS